MIKNHGVDFIFTFTKHHSYVLIPIPPELGYDLLPARESPGMNDFYERSSKMYTIKPFLFSSALICSLVSSAAIANPNLMIAANPKMTSDYWTPDRMQNAAPMELPKASRTKKISLEELKAQNKDEKSEIIARAAFPSVHLAPQQHQLYEPIQKKEGFKPQDTGTLNEQFSSSQLIPLSADQNYPYITIGKLFFTTPTGNKTCSGAVVAKRLVLTAGHCVHNGNGTVGGYYTNFKFVPAFHQGNAPFQTWNANMITIGSQWYTGGGTVPNAGDWALLVMADKTIDGTSQSIGNVVGNLGIQTFSTIPNHAHIFGYPGNLDNGQLIHEVTSQSSLAVDPNNAEYGSDMNLGTGGSPFIQNFGIASDGTIAGSNPARNMIVGLASYGYSDTVTFALGSSILNASFTNYFNSVCNFKAGNC
jgi:V8-like Glu-specific endopeptidase